MAPRKSPTDTFGVCCGALLRLVRQLPPEALYGDHSDRQQHQADGHSNPAAEDATDQGTEERIEK
jgi:hypothetical protein